MDDLIAFFRRALDELELFAQAQLEGLPAEYVGDITPAQALAAYALADVAVKRAVLTAYDGAVNGVNADLGVADALEDIVRQAVAIYSDHPDYRQEWKP